jgi:hypothetical protein
VGCGRKFRGVDFSAPNSEDTSEIGNYSMDRNEVVAVPEVVRWKINLGFNILTVVTLLACEGCGSLV